LLDIKVASLSKAISLSVVLKRPDRSFGGTTDSRASSFTDGSTRVYRKCAAAHLKYAEVDLEMKAKALARCDIPAGTHPKRWRRDTGVIEFLKSL